MLGILLEKRVNIKAVILLRVILSHNKMTALDKVTAKSPGNLHTKPLHYKGSKVCGGGGEAQ